MDKILEKLKSIKGFDILQEKFGYIFEDKKLRLIVIFGGLALIILLIYLIVPSPDEEKSLVSKTQEVKAKKTQTQSKTQIKIKESNQDKNNKNIKVNINNKNNTNTDNTNIDDFSIKLSKLEQLTDNIEKNSKPKKQENTNKNKKENELKTNKPQNQSEEDKNKEVKKKINTQEIEDADKVVAVDKIIYGIDGKPLGIIIDNHIYYVGDYIDNKKFLLERKGYFLYMKALNNNISYKVVEINS